MALARTIIRQVKFIIMDEGTSALDDENAIEIEKNLVSAKDFCVIFITHHLKDVIKQNLDDVYPMQSKEKAV